MDAAAARFMQDADIAPARLLRFDDWSKPGLEALMLSRLVDGIGALRTHASSAHGAGKKQYKLEPRHARLAIHSAHTVTLFILESWARRSR